MKSIEITPASSGSTRAWLPRLNARTRSILRWAAIAVTWGLLAFCVFLTGMFLSYALLAAILLGKGPTPEDMPVLIIALVLTGGAALLAGWAARSLRKSGLFLAAGLGVVMLGWIVWAALNPTGALFIARQIAWPNSNVKDYLLFPERAVANAAPVYTYMESPGPVLSGPVAYTSNGRPMQADFEDFLRSTNTTSFIVIKDDAIVYEGYFNGYQRDSVVTSFSMAKSITSALVGIAIDEGYFGLEDPVIQYVPELKGRGLDNLTIRHLLNMSSGIGFVTDDELSPLVEIFQFTDEGLTYSYPDLRALALDAKPGDAPVGAEFNYNGYHTPLLGIILERATGMTPSAYLQEKIWKPLGTEFPASWSLDSEKGGFELMGAGINGRAIDFAKIGSLYLHNGTWQGRQIIPAAWVQESTAPDPADTRAWHSDRDWKQADGYYKYLWWGRTLPGGGYDFEAHGHDGQRIFVAPLENIVIVRFGLDEGGVDSWTDVFQGLVLKMEPESAAWRLPSSELPRSTPEQQGFDSAKTAEGLEAIRLAGIPIHSLLVVRHGSVILDAYFYPYDGAIYHDMASVTKSVMTTLIGIAADQGKIDLERTVLSYFPDRTIANMDTRKEAITVRDLLSMRSGFDCGGSNEEMTAQMRATPDWAQFSLDRPMAAKPGTRFSYCDVSLHLLSPILREATGMTTLDFGQQYLFGPLSIENLYWPADPQGNQDGWGDLSLRPADMAKIGLLFLHNGAWNGKQIVSASWVKEATSKKTSTGGWSGQDYGYGWWVSPKGADVAYFNAEGRMGQRISVVPSMDMVFVTTGAGFDQDQIDPYLIGAIADLEKPLPANPEGVAKLEAALAHRESAQECELLIYPMIDNSKALRKLFSIPEENEVAGSMILGFPKYKYQRGIRRHLKNVTWL